MCFTMCSLRIYRCCQTRSINVKVHHLMSLLSMIPDLELICLDSCQCFDANKQNIIQRIEEEKNPEIRKILKSDLEFLDSIQVEMSTARQFMFSSEDQAIKRKDKYFSRSTVRQS